MKEHAPQVTRAWVLHPDIKSDPQRRDAAMGLEEAVSLAAALPDLQVVGKTIVPLPKPHPGMLFGSGKIEELKTIFHDHEVDLVPERAADPPERGGRVLPREVPGGGVGESG